MPKKYDMVWSDLYSLPKDSVTYHYIIHHFIEVPPVVPQFRFVGKCSIPQNCLFNIEKMMNNQRRFGFTILAQNHIDCPSSTHQLNTLLNQYISCNLINKHILFSLYTHPEVGRIWNVQGYVDFNVSGV